MLSKIMIFRNSKILYFFQHRMEHRQEKRDFDEQVVEWAHARGLTNGAHLREKSTLPSCDHTQLYTTIWLTHDEQRKSTTRQWSVCDTSLTAKTLILHVLSDVCFLIICQIKDCKTQPNHSVAYMTKKHGSVHIQLYNILPYVGSEWFWISQCL